MKTVRHSFMGGGGVQWSGYRYRNVIGKTESVLASNSLGLAFCDV